MAGSGSMGPSGALWTAGPAETPPGSPGAASGETPTAGVLREDRCSDGLC